MAQRSHLKIYPEILTDATLGLLPNRLWRRTIEIFLLANDNNGELPNLENMAWLLHLEEKILEQDLFELVELELIKNVGNSWYVPKFRKCNKSEPEKSDGFVYLIRADNGAYKIGRTKDLNTRLSSLDVALPYDINIVHVIETKNPNKLEQYFHEQFANKRLKGEWFQLSDNDIHYFQTFRLAE